MQEDARNALKANTVPPTESQLLPVALMPRLDPILM